jgi:RecQ family ATP-dependent DNA helicase
MDKKEKRLLRYEKYNKLLKEYFGFDKLKKEQATIIDKIVHYKRDVLAVLCTGFGKSMCFILPYLITKKCVIVVSPLISLMEDQRAKLEKMKIPVYVFNSTNKSKTDYKKFILNGHYGIIYVTPEYIPEMQSFIENLNELGGLSLISFDECHCVTQWGADFRPAYSKLGIIRSWIPSKIPFLCVTATATKKVRDDVVKIMKLDDPYILIGDFDRPSLYISVQKKTTIEKDIKPLLEKYINEYVIIFCKTRADTEKIAEKIIEMGVDCLIYHAGLNEKERDSIQKKFTKGDTKVITATNSFSMGIDIANVRLLIHYGCPQNLESYYQEIGRASRDKKPSDCNLFFDNKDFMINSLQIADIKNKQYKEYQEQAKRDMEKYIYTHECRRIVLLKHFNEDATKKIENCNNCDNCKLDIKKKDFTWESYVILSLIKEHNDKWGATMFIDILKGSNSQKMYKNGLTTSKFHGVGKDFGIDKWKDLIKILITNDYLGEKQVSKFGGSVLFVKYNAVNWLSNMNNNYKKLLDNPKLDVKKEHKLEFAYADNEQRNQKEYKDYEESDDDNKKKPIEIKPKKKVKPKEVKQYKIMQKGEDLDDIDDIEDEIIKIETTKIKVEKEIDKNIKNKICTQFADGFPVDIIAEQNNLDVDKTKDILLEKMLVLLTNIRDLFADGKNSDLKQKLFAIEKKNDMKKN